MSIKAIFPPGLAELTVHGLHQWDYGRKLKVMAEGLPAQVEIHFACAGMETAVVRFCGATNGAFLAAIPDQCLEQTTPIVAWVCEVGETSGKTLLTVTLPIIARTKPQPAPTVPEDISDKYTEAVAAMNALVAECEQLVDNVAGEVEDRVAATLYKEGWTAKYAETATVLSPTKPPNSGGGNYVWKIDSPGIYAVSFTDGSSNGSAFIVVRDLTMYTRGTRTTKGSDEISLDYVYDLNANGDEIGLVVWHQSQSNKLAILGVYKLADL